MTDHIDDESEKEYEAREHLIDAEVDAEETLEEAERLESDDAEPSGGPDEAD